MLKHDIYKIVTDALFDNIKFLELRGFDSLARKDGDLDFLVPVGFSVKACLLVAKEAIRLGWFLTGFKNIGYISQIVLVRPAAKNADDAIKIDFFDGVSWYGVGDCDASFLMFEMIERGEISSDVASGIVCFIQKLMYAGKISNRDLLRIKNYGITENNIVYIGRVLGFNFKSEWLDEFKISKLEQWRLRIESHGAINISNFVKWIFSVVARHFKFKSGIKTGGGLILGLSGLDGSGKSTVLDRFVSSMNCTGDNWIDRIHLLPEWIPLPHQLVRRKKTIGNYHKPYSESVVNSGISSALRLTYYVVAFSLAKMAIIISSFRGRIIVMDRNYFDFASDPARARISLEKLPKSFSRLLMPHGLLIFLNSSPEVVYKRKGELTIEKAKLLQEKYINNALIFKIKIIDGDENHDEVYKNFLNFVSKEFLTALELQHSKCAIK